MRFARFLVVAPLSLLPQLGVTACYSVFSGNQTVYQSFVAPVDLSRPISEAVQQRFGPGASMVIQPGDTHCPEIDLSAAATVNSARTRFDASGESRNAPTEAMRASEAAHVLHTGPRGGVYYVNSNGNKTYVTQSSGRGRR